MSRQIISTPDAPAAIGTYSQAVRVGDTNLGVRSDTSGSRDQGAGRRRHGGAGAPGIRDLKAIVVAAGATFDDVVKATIFLIDLSHFALVNKVMAEYFREPYPARAAVGVSALPRGAQVEVECIVAL